MEPLTVVLGIGLLYLLLSRRGIDAGSGIGSAGGGYGGNTSINIRGSHTNASHDASKTSGGPVSVNPSPTTPAPSRLAGLRQKGGRDRQRIQRGLNIGTAISQGALEGAQAAGFLGAYPGIGAIVNPKADAGYLAVTTAGRTLQTVGERTSMYFGGTVGSTGLSGGLFSAGRQTSRFGNFLEANAGIGAIGGSVGLTAALGGFRGASSGQQKALLGQGALEGTTTALSVIPGIGAAAGAGIRALAGTYEGQRAVAQVGRTLYQGYAAQRSLLSGDIGGAAQAFQGGSSHGGRTSRLFGLVASRVSALQRGGSLTAQDIAGFQQAKAYGIQYVNGFNLANLNLAAQGSNPFLGKTRS